MRANENMMIVDDEIVLVPYREEHVAKYHEWMSSEELRELTASEPLSLEEEYDMQKKWQIDEDKLTFIICAYQKPAHETTAGRLHVQEQSQLTMIGDVNLFLKGAPDEDEFEVEIEIMIAEPAFRRRGLAMTALELMLSYATSPTSPSPLPVPKDRLVVRIGEKNEASRRLFEKLGFVVTKRVEVFEEIEMRFEASGKLSEDQSRSWRTGEIRPFVL